MSQQTRNIVRAVILLIALLAIMAPKVGKGMFDQFTGADKQTKSQIGVLHHPRNDDSPGR